MHDILNQILSDTRAVVARSKREMPVSLLEDRPLFGADRRSLAEALRCNNLAFVAECKRTSPSRGRIRNDYDIPALARSYHKAGAEAISVLTEPIHFEGSPDDMSAARREVDTPLLRKDFIFDPYQLFEARAIGADAILLIAAALDPSQLYDLHQAADELRLSCLVEVHDLREIETLDFDQIRVLGVNNRDLRTFEVNIDHAPKVFSHVPAGIVRVAESGLKTSREMAYLRSRGVDAVLIGETLMRADDPGDMLAILKKEVAERITSKDLSV